MANTLYTLSDTDLVVTPHDKPYVLRLRDLPVDERPREKLCKYGPSVLSASELLAVVLNVGTKREEVMTMANRVLAEYGEKGIAHQTDPKKVMKLLSLPETKACQIVACFELGRRFFDKGTGRAITIRTAQQAHQYLKEMGDLPKEHLRGLYLNNHYRLIHDEVISIGSVTANIVHPREVFRPALEYAASAVVIAHNHPSGILTPSKEDVQITKQLAKAGSVLGIDLLDHIIITNKGFVSISVTYAAEV